MRFIDVIPTGNILIDRALGVGGFPRGRVVEVFGPESSGKTTLTLTVIAQAQKRGGAAQHITLDEGVAAEPQRDLNLLALDDALTRLEQIDPEKSRMVELRFFSGLSVAETAEVMGVSPRTIDRQWQTAKAWLYREIGKAA